MNKTKLKVILGSLLVITVALLLRLKGNMDQKRNEKENIDNQRITAMTVKMIEPRVEKIIFSKSFFYSSIWICKSSFPSHNKVSVITSNNNKY